MNWELQDVDWHVVFVRKILHARDVKETDTKNFHGAKMKKVLIGCYKDNIASAATIKKNGGVLVNESDNYNEGRISQYYSINL